MTLSNSIKSCFLKYVDWSGRASRSEYWYFHLFFSLLSVCMDIVDATIAGKTYWSYKDLFGPAQSIFFILFTLPYISVSIRRLHDINKSGWWLLILLTPGIFILPYWHIRESDKDSNDFGNPPLEILNKEIYKLSRWVKYFLVPIYCLLTLGTYFVIVDWILN